MSAVEFPRGLSPQRAQVLWLLGHGYNRKMVAALLGISPHTAKDHIRAVCEHFGVHGSHAEKAVALARESGLLPQVNPPLWGNAPVAVYALRSAPEKTERGPMRSLNEEELEAVSGGRGWSSSSLLHSQLRFPWEADLPNWVEPASKPGWVETESGEFEREAPMFEKPETQPHTQPLTRDGSDDHLSIQERWSALLGI